jgi:perosamine synthetase
MLKAIPWWKPEIGSEEYDRVRAVLDSNYINDGDVTAEFEKRIATLAGAKHAVAVTSGTSAIALALKGLGVGPGDEVLVPDITFIATANAVVLAGAKPVLVDIDPQTLTIDCAAAARVISAATRAIVPVHVSGRGADMQAVLALAKRHNLFVVEDAAEAFMSRRMDRCLGSIGDAGCLSFSPNKTIMTGQGGMILTDNESLFVQLRELKDQGRPVRGTGGDDIHHSIGFNFKFTNLQAAIGLAQLSYLNHRLQQMRRVHEIYAHELRDLANIHLPGFALSQGEVPQWTDAIVDRRNELDQYLLSKNVHCRRFWLPIHSQAPYRLSDDMFPNSTSVSPRAIWLPSAFTLTDDDVKFVCAHIKAFFAHERGGVFSRKAAI